MGLKWHFLFECSAIIEQEFYLWISVVIFDFGSHGQLFYYIRGLYPNLFTHAFSEVLIFIYRLLIRRIKSSTKLNWSGTIIFSTIFCQMNCEL